MELEELIKELIKAFEEFGNIPLRMFQTYEGFVGKISIGAGDEGIMCLTIDSQ